MIQQRVANHECRTRHGPLRNVIKTLTARPVDPAG